MTALVLRFQNALDDWSRLAHLIEANERIHLQQGLAQLAREALRHATADDQLLSALLAESALLMRFEDRLDRFFFRRIDERAGVHDEHVSVISIGGDPHSALQHAAKHD